jgi:hypothetical protein
MVVPHRVSPRKPKVQWTFGPANAEPWMAWLGVSRSRVSRQGRLHRKLSGDIGVPERVSRT